MDSQSPANIDGTSNLATMGMVIESCRVGGRTCPNRETVFVRNGNMVALEAVVSGASRGGDNRRRAMMSS